MQNHGRLGSFGGCMPSCYILWGSWQVRSLSLASSKSELQMFGPLGQRGVPKAHGKI